MPNLGMSSGFGGANCVCSLPTLVILILIVLQFSKIGKYEHDDDSHIGNDIVGNGILFIIALFFLSCTNCRSNIY